MQREHAVEKLAWDRQRQGLVSQLGARPEVPPTPGRREVPEENAWATNGP
jgi:hypothetical protein